MIFNGKNRIHVLLSCMVALCVMTLASLRAASSETSHQAAEERWDADDEEPQAGRSPRASNSEVGPLEVPKPQARVELPTNKQELDQLIEATLAGRETRERIMRDHAVKKSYQAIVSELEAGKKVKNILVGQLKKSIDLALEKSSAGDVRSDDQSSADVKKSSQATFGKVVEVAYPQRAEFYLTHFIRPMLAGKPAVGATGDPVRNPSECVSWLSHPARIKWMLDDPEGKAFLNTIDVLFFIYGQDPRARESLTGYSEDSATCQYAPWVDENDREDKKRAPEKRLRNYSWKRRAPELILRLRTQLYEAVNAQAARYINPQDSFKPQSINVLKKGSTR